MFFLLTQPSFKACLNIPYCVQLENDIIPALNLLFLTVCLELFCFLFLLFFFLLSCDLVFGISL